MTYAIVCNHGFGYETVTTETKLTEALRKLHEYRNTDYLFPYKLRVERKVK